MSETPDETRLWLREQLARSDQLQADADRRRQVEARSDRLFNWIVLPAAAAGAFVTTFTFTLAIWLVLTREIVRGCK